VTGYLEDLCYQCGGPQKVKAEVGARHEPPAYPTVVTVHRLIIASREPL
jgi:hypothetical protein